MSQREVRRYFAEYEARGSKHAELRDYLAAELTKARDQIRTEHRYKAALGGSPCVCEYCKEAK